MRSSARGSSPKTAACARTARIRRSSARARESARFARRSRRWRRRAGACSSSARAAPERSSSRRRFTTEARAPTRRSSKMNCAAIPHELIESTLFGHEKGAFTGATAMATGKFEQAHGGTLLLDEVGDMSLETQAKLLRVLEAGEIERVGGRKTIPVDVRVISATNKNPQRRGRGGTLPRGLVLSPRRRADRGPAAPGARRRRASHRESLPRMLRGRVRARR